MSVFCDEDDVKLQAPEIAASYVGWNTRIADQITQATQLVRLYTRRVFDKGTYTEFFTPGMMVTRPPTKFWLKETPIVAGSISIRVSYSQLWDDTDEEDVNAYAFDLDKGKITYFNSLSRHNDAVRIIYQGGYDVASDITAVPDDVRIATALQAAYSLKRLADEQLAQKSEEGRPIPTTLDEGAGSGLIPEARRLVSHYRRIYMG